MDLCLWLNLFPRRVFIEAEFGITVFKDLSEMSPNPPSPSAEASHRDLSLSILMVLFVSGALLPFTNH